MYPGVVCQKLTADLVAKYANGGTGNSLTDWDGDSTTFGTKGGEYSDVASPLAFNSNMIQMPDTVSETAYTYKNVTNYTPFPDEPTVVELVVLIVMDDLSYPTYTNDTGTTKLRLTHSSGGSGSGATVTAEDVKIRYIGNGAYFLIVAINRSAPNGYYGFLKASTYLSGGFKAQVISLKAV